MKKKLLFVYYEMMLGGSTTSLISLLCNIDYSKYDVDLLMYRNRGPFMPYIPPQVNILPQAQIYHGRYKKLIRLIFSGALPMAVLKSSVYRKKLKPNSQLMALATLKLCRKEKKNYDTAIGYLEGWSDNYVNKYVSADKKISWIHIDYEKAHYLPEIDRKSLEISDVVVCVSRECLGNFNKSFPSLKNRTVLIENILSAGYLNKRADESVDDPTNNYEGLKLLTVCRLAIEHKGLDRGIRLMDKLVNSNGYNLRWYIIGEGIDRTKIEMLINKYHLEQSVILLGAKDNPYPYFKFFDAFVMFSRFEGKPMAVTEAMMLKLPPIVTEYASAHEQIENGVDGIIIPQDEDAVFDFYRKLVSNTEILIKLKEKLQTNVYDNVDEMKKINGIFM